MKSVSPALLTAIFTALVTIGLIALLFLFPVNLDGVFDTDIGLRKNTPVISAKKSFATKGTTRRGKMPTRGDLSAADTTPAMTMDRLNAIITRLDDKVEKPRNGFWRFTVNGATVIVVGDETFDRLRILVGIQSAKDLTPDQLMQIAKSNYDTALDARYAISQKILWSMYAHPLKSLGDRQFISAIGQTVNLAISYGDGYSSGGILFEGGDVKDVQRNKMIEDLIKKGLKA